MKIFANIREYSAFYFLESNIVKQRNLSNNSGIETLYIV